MAKMFYTLEEAAARLGMGEDEVKALGESGQLQEFRDRDRLMFKRDQVDLLAGDDAGGDDDDLPDEIRLADSGELEPLSLSSSGSGSAFNATPAPGSGSSAGDTGVSIFDPDDTGDADANADTLITGAAISPADLASDASSSGSGLSQLTLEPDDTSLGSDLMSGLGGGDSAAGFGTASGTGGGTAFGAGASASGAAALSSSEAGSLFEGDSHEPEFGAAAAGGAAMMPMLEEYDGPWSGITAGASVGMILMLVVGLAVTILGFTGAGASSLLAGVGSSTILIVAGAGVAVVGICAAIGWVMLRKG